MERRREGDRGSRDRDRDDDRGRDNERGQYGGRDRNEGRERDDDRRGSRDREDDRGSSRRWRDDDDRGSSRRGGSGSSSGYKYQARSAEDVRERANNDSKFDKLLKPGVKMWKVNDGDNRVRILPATWPKAQHYGLDIHVHYGVGADRQAYLCLNKMLGKPDPIHEEYERFAREADPDNKDDAKYLKDLKGTGRVLVYIVDRDNEKEGVQAWAMPAGLDRDLAKVSVDKDTGEVLPIDHPEEGYDVTFDKSGKGVNTKYEGVSVARRSSPLGKSSWMDFAVDNPLPDQLQYFDYDHIAKAFGQSSGPKPADRDEDRDRGRSSDRDEPRRREDGRDRDRGGEDGRGSRRDRSEPVLSWESIHDMTRAELKDLVEAERLTKIDPREAKDDEDLADWVCDELRIEKPKPRERERERDDDEPRRRPAADDDAPRRRGDDPDLDARMAKMRERRD